MEAWLLLFVKLVLPIRKVTPAKVTILMLNSCYRASNHVFNHVKLTKSCNSIHFYPTFLQFASYKVGHTADIRGWLCLRGRASIFLLEDCWLDSSKCPWARRCMYESLYVALDKKHLLNALNVNGVIHMFPKNAWDEWEHWKETVEFVTDLQEIRSEEVQWCHQRDFISNTSDTTPGGDYCQYFIIFIWNYIFLWMSSHFHVISIMCLIVMYRWLHVKWQKKMQHVLSMHDSGDK